MANVESSASAAVKRRSAAGPSPCWYHSRKPSAYRRYAVMDVVVTSATRSVSVRTSKSAASRAVAGLAQDLVHAGVAHHAEPRRTGEVRRPHVAHRPREVRSVGAGVVADES